MNLFDLPPFDDNPVDSMLSFHRRLERQLAALGRLPLHIETRGVDVEAAAIAGGVLHCMGVTLPRHHAEEEHDLIPLLQRRIAAGEREALHSLRAALELDHREIQRLWRTLRKSLEPITEGAGRKLPVDDIQYFRAVCATHVSAEEATIHLLALRHLLPEDRTALSQRIRARRERASARA